MNEKDRPRPPPGPPEPKKSKTSISRFEAPGTSTDMKKASDILIFRDGGGPGGPGGGPGGPAWENLRLG